MPCEFNHFRRNGFGAALLGTIVLMLPTAAAGEEPGPSAATTAKQRSATYSASTNFAVFSYADGPNATAFARSCEQLRQSIQRRWLGNSATASWHPRCRLVLHATRDSYLKAVGASGGQTMGSSLIKRQKSRIVERRIDLYVDEQGNTGALAHELTHVVLADVGGGQPLPPWLDEGIATLADSDDKLSLHRRDCHLALDRGTAFHLTQLMTLDRLSSPSEFPTFYGQSVSLVGFLCRLDKPEKLLSFAALAMEKGYDAALRTSYDIDGVGHLQRLWLEDVAETRHQSNIHAVSLRRLVP